MRNKIFDSVNMGLGGRGRETHCNLATEIVKNTCVYTSGSQSITILSSTSIVITLGSDISLRKQRPLTSQKKPGHIKQKELNAGSLLTRPEIHVQ